MENCDGKINEGHERTVCKKSNRWDTGKVREVRKVWNKLSTTRRTVCRKSNRWDTGNAEMDGGREEGLIMLFHMPLSRFSTIVVVIMFFFYCFSFVFIVFYLVSLVVFVRIEGLIILFHTPFSRFSTIVVFIVIVISLFSCRWIRWKSSWNIMN